MDGKGILELLKKMVDIELHDNAGRVNFLGGIGLLAIFCIFVLETFIDKFIKVVSIIYSKDVPGTSSKDFLIFVAIFSIYFILCTFMVDKKQGIIKIIKALKE